MPEKAADRNARAHPRKELAVAGSHGQGPKYTVNIDDVDHDWDRETISVPEIRTLGGIEPGTAVLEVDLKTNIERTLDEDEIVTLKPGVGFGKKVRFKRG
jgi:hypothetical protein